MALVWRGCAKYFVCDGDTKAIAEIKKDAPLEVAGVIEALLDLNHVSKNTGGKLRDLKGYWGNTISDTVSSCLQKGFQSAVYTSREQMTKGEDGAVQVARMKKNILAVPAHYFNDHTNCGDWCKAKTDSNHRPHSLPWKRYLVDQRKEDGAAQRSFRADVDAIFEQYSSDAMCKKLLHNLPSNKCEAVHGLHWTHHASKNKFCPTMGSTQWLATQNHVDMGRGHAMEAVQAAMALSELGEAAHKGMMAMDKRAAAKKAVAKTPDAKIARARQKRKRKARDADDDEGHNAANHLSSDDPTEQPAPAAEPRGPSKCGVCKQPGHDRRSCPHKDCATPETPNPTALINRGDVIVCFDLEYQLTHVVLEIGAVATSYSSRGTWSDGAGEYNAVIKGVAVKAQVKKVCHGLADDILRHGVDFVVAWRGFLMHIETWRGDAPRVWLKAHNGVSCDMRYLVAHAARAGVTDPVGELERVGVAGIIDPARIIPTYGLTALQQEKEGTGDKAGTKVKHGYLGNGALYALATGGVDMKAAGLAEHRATDDAKAERTWLQKLPDMTAIVFGADRKACGITMAQYRAYHDQYDKNAALLARLG